MREIKFRQWDSVYNIMHYNIGVSPEGWLGFPQVFWYRYPIMQYTGLKDKTGKEIYEGDIFKDDIWWVGKAVVEFENGMFCFLSEFDNDYVPINDCQRIEIIGNIYEHPLLTSE